jgi:hypothetical protein
MKSAERIRALNDEFRANLRTGGGRILITAGVRALLGMEKIGAIIHAVSIFDDFTEDNDPHGEHDFGAFEVDGHKLFFKLDYYDKAMKFGSPDPANPDVTTRIVTVMLSEEY